MKWILVFLLFLMAVPATASRPVLPIPLQQQLPSTKKFSLKIIAAAKSTYGYEVYENGKLLIKQTTIPGQQGNTGFKRRSDAVKLGQLVITKLQKGIMPPTVEKSEMDKLGILY